MALHGTIEINGRTIGLWEAVRQDNLTDPDQVSSYACRVSVRQLNSPVVVEWEDVLEHRYSDGAAVLAAKVLSAYAGVPS